MHDLTIYVVDDDPAVLKSVQTSLRAAGLVPRAFSSAEAFMAGCHFHHAACLILDLEMPGMTGMELLEWLRARHIDVPAIVVSGHGNIPAVVNSMKLGAVEFLEKPANAGVLISKVRELLEADGLQCDKRAKTQDIRNRFATLTGRERELVELLANGLSSKQIAIELGISCHTVHNHRSNLLAKTKAANVASLVRMKMSAAEFPAAV